LALEISQLGFPYYFEKGRLNVWWLNAFFERLEISLKKGSTPFQGGYPRKANAVKLPECSGNS